MGSNTDRRFGLSCYGLIVNDRHECLLLRRPDDKRFAPGQWELPGGKVDRGEAVDEALRREVAEEAGLAVRPRDCLGSVIFEAGQVQAIMLVFRADCDSDSVTISSEHSEFRWVPLDEVARLELTDPLRRFIAGCPLKGASGGD